MYGINKFTIIEYLSICDSLTHQYVPEMLVDKDKYIDCLNFITKRFEEHKKKHEELKALRFAKSDLFFHMFIEEPEKEGNKDE